MSSGSDAPGPPAARTGADLRDLAPILIVDDNAGKRTALRAVLAPLGYPIVEADSGRAALRCLLARNFAVILLDVRMPLMDGFETAGLIRQRRQSETTPIIFITSYAIDELGTSDRYVEGAVDFMFAPVPPEELRAKVQVFLTLFTQAESLASAAREVQTTADQLRLLTEAAPIGIFQTDEQNRYVYTNPQWTAITGIPADGVAGKPWDTIIDPAEQLTPVPERPGYQSEPADLSQRFRIVLPEQGVRILQLTARAVPAVEGGTAGWVGTLADVTTEVGADRAMSEARDSADQASQLKSEFLANMSHEIRTPMNGVIGMTDLLLDTELDARQRDYAQTVRSSGDALLAIINNILDFSKVEAGMLEVDDGVLDLRAVLDDVVDLLGGPGLAGSVELAAAVDASVPHVVRGDPGLVRQVLTNLIGNAVKFTAVGDVVIRVRVAEKDGPDLLIRTEVSDTGDGIPADKLSTIYQPFVQADSSTSRKYGGTGLGLAITGRLVALMGGECGVTSELGNGSTFWFTVRVRSDAFAGAPRAPAPATGLAGLRALIVIGNAHLREVVEGYLDGWGMSVEVAAALAEGLDAARRAPADAPFAVAVIDSSVPDLDDSETAEAEIAAEFPDLRLVWLGTAGHHGDLAADDVPRSILLAKPVHRRRLRTSLRVLLGLEPAPTRPAEAAPDAPGDGSGRGRILLAEDNPINRKVALTMLSDAGYEVTTVVNGVAAVEAVTKRRYDLILMDCQMPELNGYQATAAIRDRERPGQRVPIIALTAGARREDEERCAAAGMDGYLSKPVRKAALLDLVSRTARPIDRRPATAPAPVAVAVAE